MKKLILLVLAALMPVAAFAGCKDTDGDMITVVSREEGSGTRGAFIELFGIQRKDENGNKIDYTTENADITNSTSVMLTMVAGNSNAFGYVSMGSLNNTVKAVKIGGAEPTVENIKSGAYKIFRPFYIATKGNIGNAAQDFINFILSAEGQAVIEDNGYIKAAEGTAFGGSTANGKVTVAGSSSITPVMEKLKEAYQAVNPNAKIEIQQSDSTTGMNSAIEGICDIGMASRELKDSEISAGLIPILIASDGMAVIVNKGNSVSDLTIEQVMEIFTGKTVRWSEIND